MNTNEYYIDGVALPGGGLAVCRTADLEAGDTGRDESGFLHRWVLRQGLRRWEFSYRDMDDAAAGALLAQLPRQDSWLLTCPEGQTLCHLKETTHRQRTTLTGTNHDITLTIEEC